MRSPFRHRKAMRKHEAVHKAHKMNQKGYSYPMNAQGFFMDRPTENIWSNVVVPTSYRYDEGMSGKEVNQMNKSYRVAMAQALLTELAEATTRYGSDNDGVKRLHRMVRAMVAELLA